MQYMNWMKTNETIDSKKKPKLYKKRNNYNTLLGSAISNVYIATNTVNTNDFKIL